MSTVQANGIRDDAALSDIAIPFYRSTPILGSLAVILLTTVVYFVYHRYYRSAPPSKRGAHVQVSSIDAQNSVSLADMAYLAHVLSPQSTHMDVLWAAISTPEMLQTSEAEVHKVERIRRDRQSRRATQKPNIPDELEALVEDDDGWGEDEDDVDESDQAAAQVRAKAKQAEQERQQDMERLKAATGQTNEPLEGIDPGVIGQTWVEATLAQHQSWPPPLTDVITAHTYTYEDQPVANPLDHKGLRRYLCMTMGRLNAQILNTKPELLQAGAQKLIDQTYFRGSLEFRGRVGTLLEAILRLGTVLKSRALVATTIEAVASFKVGCLPGKSTTWFLQTMQRQYGCQPHLAIHEKKVEVPLYEESNILATGDMAEFFLDLERTHAENFLKQKIAMCQKQGIPPQVALQAYREGWWFLLRAENVKDPSIRAEPIMRESPILSKLDSQDLDKFEAATPAAQRLITAWPMIVQNCAQKAGKVRIQFPVPSIPGKYRFVLDIKSQDFLGADQQIVIEKDVVDAQTIQRTLKPKEEQAIKNEESKGETKKEA